MILRARVVLPLSQPPIADGAVAIRGRRIVKVGSWRKIKPGSRSRIVDLGEVVLMPGLVNAHCHLDYTHMAGQIPPPKSFTEWLKVIVATKAGWTLPDYKASWEEGAADLVQTGTTTVADMEAVPELLPGVWEATPLRLISFLEMIGITPRRPPPVLLRETLERAAELKDWPRLGLSPHAAYSTLPELLRMTANAAKKRRCLISIHLSESAVEYEMFRRGRGEMFDWLERSGRDMSDCGLGTPVQHLARNNLLGPNVLAAHVNYLGKGDAELLARKRVSVVHCPRSHSYFRHGKFPLSALTSAGVNICLGTDSLASVYKEHKQSVKLDMFTEMRCLAQRESSLSPQDILKMATINGARALQLGAQIGELSAGVSADLIAFPFYGRARDASEAAVFREGPLNASIIRGAWIQRPPQTAVGL